MTRALAAALPAGSRIVAPDRNQPMLDRAAAVGAWFGAGAVDAHTTTTGVES